MPTTPPVLPVSQESLDKLDAAIVSGERQITIGDEAVTYQTVASLIAARDHIARLLKRPNSRLRLMQYGGRGYE